VWLKGKQNKIIFKPHLTNNWTFIGCQQTEWFIGYALHVLSFRGNIAIFICLSTCGHRSLKPPATGPPIAVLSFKEVSSHCPGYLMLMYRPTYRYYEWLHSGWWSFLKVLPPPFPFS
jgi:hypothetical protein